MPRRTVLRGLATGLAGAVAAPITAGPVAQTGSQPAAAPTASTSSGTLPRLLDEQERASLVRLCELLVPGSVEAGVPELLDQAAAVDAPEGRQEFLKTLRAFEGEARARHAARFVDLEEAQQIAILEGEGDVLRAALVHLRDAAARTYFATEPGMRKLGWTGRSAWRELPACRHPGDEHP